MPIPIVVNHVNLTNPPPLRYRKRRRRPLRSIEPAGDEGAALSSLYLTPRGHLRPTASFGVPNEWTRFLDMLLWSFRGNSAAVNAQLQDRYKFHPPIRVDWVRLRLRETAAHQLAWLQKFLPGETGTILRVRIRATVINAGNDLFHEGPTEDDTPEPGSSAYSQHPPLPPGGPENWNWKWDIILCQSLGNGEDPIDILRLLRKMRHPDLKGLTKAWLEERMAQSGHLGIDVQDLARDMKPQISLKKLTASC